VDFGIKPGTSRGREDRILIDAADDVMKLAPTWRTVELSSLDDELPSRSPFHTAQGDGWSTSVEELLGASDVKIADSLFRGARLPRGFDAQEFGRGELSRASSATVIYAYAALPWVEDSAGAAPVRGSLQLGTAGRSTRWEVPRQRSVADVLGRLTCSLGFDQARKLGSWLAQTNSPGGPLASRAAIRGMAVARD
jgi:hypothetical protein